MEELLNKLIEKGWKVFGMGKKRKVFARGDKTVSFSYQDDEGIEFYTYLIRDVVTKESGLWQFVCENGMVRLDTDSGESDSYLCYYNIDGYPKDDRFEMERDDYRFRLIESALKDESELEDFLLDNIKV